MRAQDGHWLLRGTVTVDALEFMLRSYAAFYRMCGRCAGLNTEQHLIHTSEHYEAWLACKSCGRADRLDGDGSTRVLASRVRHIQELSTNGLQRRYTHFDVEVNSEDARTVCITADSNPGVWLIRSRHPLSIPAGGTVIHDIECALRLPNGHTALIDAIPSLDERSIHIKSQTRLSGDSDTLKLHITNVGEQTSTLPAGKTLARMIVCTHTTSISEHVIDVGYDMVDM